MIILVLAAASLMPLPSASANHSNNCAGSSIAADAWVLTTGDHWSYDARGGAMIAPVYGPIQVLEYWHDGACFFMTTTVVSVGQAYSCDGYCGWWNVRPLGAVAAYVYESL